MPKEKRRTFSALLLLSSHPQDLLDYLLHLTEVQVTLDMFILLHFGFDIISQSQEMLHTTLPLSPVPVYLIRVGGEPVWFRLFYPLEILFVGLYIVAFDYRTCFIIW